MSQLIFFYDQPWARCPNGVTIRMAGRVEIGSGSIFISILMLWRDQGAKIICWCLSKLKIEENWDLPHLLEVKYFDIFSLKVEENWGQSQFSPIFRLKSGNFGYISISLYLRLKIRGNWVKSQFSPILLGITFDLRWSLLLNLDRMLGSGSSSHPDPNFIEIGERNPNQSRPILPTLWCLVGIRAIYLRVPSSEKCLYA